MAIRKARIGKKVAPRAKTVSNDFQDECVKRISECQSVIEHLETCPAWEVIQRDLLRNKQTIDDNWWKIPEGDPKLQELRVTALAYMHLLNLTDTYKLDLENAKKQLDVLQNGDTKIIKDYDAQ